MLLPTAPRSKYRTRGQQNGKYVASTPEAGYHFKDTPDHGEPKGTSKKGEKTEYKDPPIWAFEATLAAAVGDAFACVNEGGLLSLIVGMSFDVPGIAPYERIFEALESMTSRADIPKGCFIADLLYWAGQAAAKFHILLRQMGFRAVADIRKDQQEVKEVAESLALIDGQWYCESILTRKELVNPFALFQAGEIGMECFQELLEVRTAYQARVTEYLPDGSVRMTCPAKGTGCTLNCGHCSPAHAGTSKKPVKLTLTLRFCPKRVQVGRVKPVLRRFH